MSFLSNLSDLLRRGAFYGAVNYIFSGVTRWNERDFKSLAKEGYKINPIAYACVNEIAVAMSGITPWKLYRTNAKGEKTTQVFKHEILTVLSDPNEEDTHADLVDNEARDYLIGGNSFQLLVQRGVLPGTPAEEEPIKPGASIIGIWRIKPDCIRIVQAKTGAVECFELASGGGAFKRRVHPTRIIHRKTYNPDSTSPYGMSPMEAAARDIDTLNVGLEYNYGLLKNNGRPDGVIFIKGKMGGREKEKQAQDQVNTSMNDPANVGKWKVMFGAEDYDLKSLATTPKDMEFQQGRTANSVGICTVYNTPPEMVGVQGQKTYSNYQEARLAFYQETVLTHMDRLKAAYNKHWVKRIYGDGLVLEYDKEGIEALQEDRDKLWKRVGDAEGKGQITNNEFREAVGLEKAPDEAADVRLIPMSLMPAEDALVPDDESTIDPITGEPVEDPALDPEDEDAEPEEGDDAKKGRRQVRAAGTLVLKMVKGENPATIFKAFDYRRSAWLVKSTRLFKKALKATYANVAEEVKAIEDAAPTQNEVDAVVRHAIAETKPLWNAAYAKVYMAVGLDFAASVDRGLTMGLGRPAGDIQRRAAGEIEAAWTARLADYLRREGGKKIQDVLSTTRKRIMNGLTDSFATGAGADVMAASITTAAGIQTARALTIARTEVIAASNLGSDTAARSFGIQLKKSWLDTGDDGRERDTHLEAGQTQQGLSLDEPFSVGMSKVMFPGDSSLDAAPGETINCRCTQTYEAA